MIKKVLLAASVFYLVVFAILSAIVFAASPGPRGQAISGVGIGDYTKPEGIAYLSGRRMDCTTQNREPLESSCTIEIAGKVLTLTAKQSLTGMGGVCTADYVGKAWPCEFGMGKSLGVMQYAYVHEPLGLSREQLQALRVRYPLENMSELPFAAGCFVLPVLNVLAVLALVWSRLPAGQRKNILLWVGSAGMSMVVWVFSVVAWMWVTAGFWD